MSMITPQIGGWYSAAIVGGTPVPTINLGAGMGQLIAPVTVKIGGVDKYFYYWNYAGSGSTSSADRLSHTFLDTIFNGGADTTNAAGTRTAVLNGVTVRLPALGDPSHVDGTTTSLNAYENGTSVSSGTQNQTTYDGLLAIWDAHNGAGTGTSLDGTPPGWASSSYFWSATSTGSGSHAGLALFLGYSVAAADGGICYVALEAINPDFV